MSELKDVLRVIGMCLYMTFFAAPIMIFVLIFGGALILVGAVVVAFMPLAVIVAVGLLLHLGWRLV